MPTANHCDIDRVDLIKELRLRRWARSNYVPTEQRNYTWNPVVLDEMLRKDQELRERACDRAIRSSYVPLPPTTITKRHDSHPSNPEPNLLRYAESFEIYIHA